MPVAIKATDQGGEPVEAELSLAVVDESIFALRSEYAEAIKAFFYDQTRRLSVKLIWRFPSALFVESQACKYSTG